MHSSQLMQDCHVFKKKYQSRLLPKPFCRRSLTKFCNTIVNQILQHDRNVFRIILRQIISLLSERHMESYGNRSMQVEKEIQMPTHCENIKPFHISRAELEQKQTRQISILNCFLSTYFHTDD